MTRERRKRIGVLLLIGAVAVPLAIVSTAWACGRLATLRLSSSSARAGQELTAFGGNYNSAPTSSPVSLHFTSRTGRVLWTGRPDSTGRITPAFTVPNVRAGYYTIVATQTLANNTPAAGTPGRAILRIGKPKSKSSRHAVALWAPPTARGSGPPPAVHRAVSVPTPVAAGGVALFLVLAGGGTMMLLGVRRTRPA